MRSWKLTAQASPSGCERQAFASADDSAPKYRIIFCPSFLTQQDIAENVVVKIADEVEMDVSRKAWQVRYPDAIATAGAIRIGGVRVPFLSLEMLIKSKTTCRDQDRTDLVRLRDLLELKRQRGGAGN